MIDITKCIATVVVFACYTMLFFNGFVYLLQANFEIFLDMSKEVMIKGFIIGLSGAFISEKLNLRFIPSGWIGAVLGLVIVNYLLIFTTVIFSPNLTPYKSFFPGSSLLYISQFLLMTIIGTFVYIFIKSIIPYFYERSVTG
jgi:hypothetical protein